MKKQTAHAGANSGNQANTFSAGLPGRLAVPASDVLPVYLPQPPQKINTGPPAQFSGGLLQLHQIMDRQLFVESENNGIPVDIGQGEFIDPLFEQRRQVGQDSRKIIDRPVPEVHGKNAPACEQHPAVPEKIFLKQGAGWAFVIKGIQENEIIALAGR